MACQMTNKRKYRPRPGAVAAALQLDVTYSHLRRVLAGQRPSKSLMGRYAALMAERGKAAKTIKHIKNGTKP
jgi:hypothetical protein